VEINALKSIKKIIKTTFLNKLFKAKQCYEKILKSLVFLNKIEGEKEIYRKTKICTETCKPSQNKEV